MFKIVPDDFVLANGQGKTRAGKYGEMRLPARWRLVFLSTGEVTLESHLASIGKRVKAGQQVRVIDPLYRFLTASRRQAFESYELSSLSD